MTETRQTAPRIASLTIEPCDICARTNQVCAKPPGTLGVGPYPCEGCGHPPACHAWS